MGDVVHLEYTCMFLTYLLQLLTKFSSFSHQVIGLLVVLFGRLFRGLGVVITFLLCKVALSWQSVCLPVYVLLQI